MQVVLPHVLIKLLYGTAKLGYADYSMKCLYLNNIQQGNFKTIVMPPPCVWVCFLFDEIYIHFQLCVMGIPANLSTVHCMIALIDLVTLIVDLLTHKPK